MACTTSIHRRFFAVFAVCGVALAAATASPRVAAQQSQPAQPALAVVTADNVLVRSGAADSYYPFGRLQRGAVVEVIGEKFNWVRVATRGPAIAAGTSEGQFFGHIIYPQTETGRFRVAADGRSGVTLGRMDVLAPNLNTNFNPNDSWKPLIRLEPDTTVRVLSTTTASNNTVHLIELPRDAEGWISKAHLREATAEEAATWRRGSGTRGEAQAAAPAATPQVKKEEVRKVEPTPAVVEKPRDERDERAPVVEAKPAVVDAEAQSEDRVAPATAETNVQTVLAREEAVAPAPAPAEAAAKPHAEAPPVVERVEKITMEDLEVLLVKLRNTPAEVAEVNDLRQMYLEFAVRNSNDRTASKFAKARAEQLEIWREVRQRRAELDRIRERSKRTNELAEMALLTIYAHADYDAIGRLTASTIFDGQRLPKMLRLQEPGTNRTLAYIEPEGHGFDLIEMLGLWIGVVGDKSYDPALRLNIITPRRIDLLAPQHDQPLAVTRSHTD